jgi:hypothetical protein
MKNITIIETTYINERTKSGNWSTVKKELEKGQVTRQFYENVLTWKPQGERRTREYTPLGYIVTRITTPHPSGDYRVVREYDFELESK